MKKKYEIFSNKRVSASAGSGKTHSLTTRFIALSQQEKNSENNPDPTGIIALTFTKKSAGEFLTKILKRMAVAIESEKELKELSNFVSELTGQEIDLDSAKLMLMQFAKNINNLHLRTIDSFFQAALKVFANEVGIFTPMQLIDDLTKANYQKAILEKIIEETDFTQAKFKNFIEYIKSIVIYDNLSASLNEKLIKEITSALYFQNNIAKNISFGEPSDFRSTPLLEWDANAYYAEVEEFKRLVVEKKVDKKFIALAEKLESYSDINFKDLATYKEAISEKFRNNELVDAVEIPYGTKGKTHSLPKEVSVVLNSILHRLFDAHFAKQLNATKTMAEILEKFKSRYFEEVISKGMLSFDDIPALLNSCEKSKDLLEYRLDSKFNHWLFDEFQDTSRNQWDFFKGIIHNVITNQNGDEKQKTFYYVGDVKQSIYSWRGGDKELFKEIFEQYKNDNNNPISDANPLTKSYRSGINVIKLVNEIFNKEKANAKTCLEETFKSKPSDDFLSIYDTHCVNKENEKTSISQLRCVKDLGEDKDFYKHIYNVIEELKDSKQSIGILVSNNKQIQAISEYLKKNGVNVAPEGKKILAQNNMLAAAFIQLLKCLAHPKDTASLEYLKMTPFKDIVAESNFRVNYLNNLSSGEYASFLMALSTRDEIKNEIKNKANLEELYQACQDFEKSNKIGIDNLIVFLENKELALSSNSNFVQVMTIHKSKGLEFSVVILPHLSELISNRSKDFGLQILRSKGKATASYLPSADIRRLNATLENALKDYKENLMFENICKFYVAITRAKNATYIVLNDSDPKKEPPMNRLLKNAFERAKTQEIIKGEDVDLYNIGNALWYKEPKEKDGDKEAEEASENTDNKADKGNKDAIKPIENLVISRSKLEVINPSKKEEEEGDEGDEANRNADALNFGTVMHKVLEQIIFIGSDIDAEIAEAISLANINENLEGKVFAILKRLFSSKDIIDIFTYKENLKVKNESDFHSEINGEVIAGQIDRLMLEKDAKGKVISAKIIDYKGVYKDTYKTQLALYKKAVESTYDLSSSQVTTHILAYHTSTLIDI